MKATNKLAEKLGSGKLALTAACLPPHDADAASVKKLAGYFPATLDGVIVADNPSKVRGSALACAALLAAEKVEPMLSLITRDRNRIALESDVLGATALGIRNFLCLTGAHQSLHPALDGWHPAERRAGQAGCHHHGARSEAALLECLDATADNHAALRP